MYPAFPIGVPVAQKVGCILPPYWIYNLYTKFKLYLQTQGHYFCGNTKKVWFHNFILVAVPQRADPIFETTAPRTQHRSGFWLVCFFK